MTSDSTSSPISQTITGKSLSIPSIRQTQANVAPAAVERTLREPNRSSNKISMRYHGLQSLSKVPPVLRNHGSQKQSMNSMMNSNNSIYTNSSNPQRSSAFFQEIMDRKQSLLKKYQRKDPVLGEIMKSAKNSKQFDRDSTANDDNDDAKSLSSIGSMPSMTSIRSVEQRSLNSQRSLSSLSSGAIKSLFVEKPQSKVPVVFPRYKQKDYEAIKRYHVKDQIHDLYKTNLEFTEEVKCDWQLLISLRGSLVFETLETDLIRQMNEKQKQLQSIEMQTNQ